MGCGCKDTNVKSIEKPIEKTPKYYLKKVGSIILVGLILLILTPLIVLMIWYLGMKMIVGTNDDYIGMVSKKYGFGKKIEPIKEEEEEINPDDYELLDVEVIK